MKKVLQKMKEKVKKPRNKKRGKPQIIQDEENRHALLNDLEMVKRNIENLDRTLDIYIGAMEKIRSKYDCLQFQRVVEDLKSAKMHIKDLEENGARDPDREIPLSESEINPEQLKNDIEQAMGVDAN